MNTDFVWVLSLLIIKLTWTNDVVVQSPSNVTVTEISAPLFFRSELSVINYLFGKMHICIVNIIMKFTVYLAWILLCKELEIGKKNLVQFWRYKTFHWGCFIIGACCRADAVALSIDEHADGAAPFQLWAGAWLHYVCSWSYRVRCLECHAVCHYRQCATLFVCILLQ